MPLPENMDNDWDRYLATYKSDDVRIKWPYIGVGIASLLTGLGFAYCYLRDRTLAIIQSRVPAIELPEEERPEFSKWKAYTAIIWIALMASICYAIEVILCE